MSLIARAAPVWRVSDFCLIFVPFGHYDEPETLPYAIRLACPISADVRHFSVTALPLFGGRGIDDLPNVQAYVARIGERPTYQKAMTIAGPAATRPNA